MAHIGIIPDGNRRYAKLKNIDIKTAYELGFNNIIEIINKLDNLNLDNTLNEITIYVCSVNNLIQRNKYDVECIYNVLNKFCDYCYSNENKMNNIGITINYAGKLGYLPRQLNVNLNNIRNKFINNTKYKLNLAIGYDGHDEIIRAVKNIDDGQITKEKIRENLYVKRDIDLVIRTGKEKRVSGFFPWQTMYTEWFFLDMYWPEINYNNIVKILKDYNKIERRYGK